MLTILKLSKIERPRGYREEGDPDVTRIAYVPFDKVRTFQPRREGIGTRLTFIDGGGYAVTETVEQIIAMLGADARIAEASPTVVALAGPAAGAA